MTGVAPRLALSVGEPAGIGPELVVRCAQRAWPAELVAFAEPELLKDTAGRLNLPLALTGFDPRDPASPTAPGRLTVAAEPLPEPVTPGVLNPDNARYVLDALTRAAEACADGACQALVTAPLHKGVINDAGIAFSGHTEFLARQFGDTPVVMMLATRNLRVALVTTHLPLRQVPDAITPERIMRAVKITHQALHDQFGISTPRLRVLGLNPHAGEGGHLGREEIDVIAPLLDRLREDGLDIEGPTPADAGFTRRALERVDAVIAMYHDQGLPVLKHAGFGEAVNVTLGLPIVRTSVDHGTALDIAGRGQANPGSLIAAIEMALQLAPRQQASATHG